MDNRLMIGIVLILLGVLVLIWPEFLRVVVALILIFMGLWFALQGAGRGGNV